MAELILTRWRGLQHYHEPGRPEKGIETCRICGAKRNWLVSHAKGTAQGWTRDGVSVRFCEGKT